MKEEKKMTMTVKEIKIAVEWLMENKGYELNQWIVDTFGYESVMHKYLLSQNVYGIIHELLEYDESTQIQLVDLIYN